MVSNNFPKSRLQLLNETKTGKTDNKILSKLSLLKYFLLSFEVNELHTAL